MPNSFHPTTLPVLSLAFYTTKLQSLKEKMSQFFSIRAGKILSLSLSLIFPEHPY
jgi:hypothetical protein